MRFLKEFSESLSKQLQEAYGAASLLSNVSVPLDLLEYVFSFDRFSLTQDIRYVDQGRNPNVYLQKFLEQCVHASDLARGKREAIRLLGKQLQQGEGPAK